MWSGAAGQSGHEGSSHLWGDTLGVRDWVCIRIQVWDADALRCRMEMHWDFRVQGWDGGALG